MSVKKVLAVNEIHDAHHPGMPFVKSEELHQIILAYEAIYEYPIIEGTYQ